MRNGGGRNGKCIFVSSSQKWFLLLILFIAWYWFVSVPELFSEGLYKELVMLLALVLLVLVVVAKAYLAGVRVYDDRVEFSEFTSKKQCFLISELFAVSLLTYTAVKGGKYTRICFAKRNGSRAEFLFYHSISFKLQDAFEYAFSRIHSLTDADAPEVDLHLHFDDNVDSVSIKHNGLPIHDDGTYTVKAKVGDWLSFTTKRSAFFYSIVDTTHTEFLIRMNYPHLSVRMPTKEGV